MSDANIKNAFVEDYKLVISTPPSKTLARALLDSEAKKIFWMWTICRALLLHLKCLSTTRKVEIDGAQNSRCKNRYQYSLASHTLIVE